MNHQERWEALDIYESFYPAGDIVLGIVDQRTGISTGTRYLIANVPAEIKISDAIEACVWFGWTDARQA